MEAWQAALLGLVEGLTEFLPVSSTGHLLVVERALGLEESAAAKAFAICIQAGAIAAVLGLYRGRVTQLARGLAGRDRDGTRLALALVVAFVPAAVVGLAFEERIEEHLFGAWPIVVAWFVGGVLILVFARGRSPRAGGMALESIGVRVALAIGAWQCLALWPGTSRSLATIAGGLVAGLSLTAAVEFSFLLGALTLFAATAWQAVKEGGAMLEAFGPLALIVGALTACVSAVLSVRWMVAWLSSHGLAVFGWYRVAIAVLVGGALLAGWLGRN